MNAFIDNRGDHDVRSVGPIEKWPVLVNGWTVPNLEASYNEEGVTLILDSRFALELPTDIAARVVEFVADAIALSLGWSCHPRSLDWQPPGSAGAPNAPVRRLPWTRMIELEQEPGS